MIRFIGFVKAQDGEREWVQRAPRAVARRAVARRAVARRAVARRAVARRAVARRAVARRAVARRVVGGGAAARQRGRRGLKDY
jgi:hypothetical protein